MATASNAACKKLDANCDRCATINGKLTCSRCLAKYALAANGKCVAANCATTSQNPGCASCNADGTCSLCTKAGQVVVPDNAQWVNRGYPASKCLTNAAANKLSKEIGLTAAVLPASCAETDAFFRCNACKAGYVLTVSGTSRTCKKATTSCRSKAYGQYCLTCGTGGKCTTCVEGRSLVSSGQCSLNCQGLFGFYCKSCTAAQCTQLFTDKVFAYFG